MASFDMPPKDLLVKQIILTFERGTAVCPSDGAFNSGAKGTGKDIHRSPLPKIAPWVVKSRFESNGQQQQEQTPPPSPELHQQQRRQSQIPNPYPEPESSSSQENSPTSTRSTSDSIHAIEEVQNELSSLELKVQALESKLKDRDQTETLLRDGLEQAINKCDEAISDLQQSQRERDNLQDMVDKLRKELREERADRRELEADLHSKTMRERELRDKLRSLTRFEEAVMALGRRNIEVQEVAGYIRDIPTMDKQLGRRRSERRGSKGNSGRDENRPPWSPNFSSQDKKGGRAVRS